MFSGNVLLYGDHPHLAARCLSSIVTTADWPYIDELRIGLNAVSLATRTIALTVAKALPVTCHIYEESQARNVWKYPMMRRMFHDPERPLSSTHIMWFDDDSYVLPDVFWWRDTAAVARNAALVGSAYRLVGGYRPNQLAGIKAQPWYAGKEPESHPYFVTGGWWILRSAVVQHNDYPFKELKHNGGDSILGELCRQCGYAIRHYNRGVAINADDAGRESKAKRRGDTTKWPWEEYPIEDLSHHDFEVLVETFRGADANL